MRKNNSQNSYRQELRERILATAMNEFYTKGIKAVKMDDIANAFPYQNARCMRFIRTKKNCC